ncbi:Transcriptional repressor NrdR [uncultured archaeon]|nr:Transcriptional repressor NrdR [uncultured archaeon]
MLGDIMNCPYCSHNASKVTDKRGSPEGIRRRRECLKCAKRFTTYEKIVQSEFLVIKKSGEREKFSREKLETGMLKAFEKRPIPREKIDQAVNELEEALRKTGKKEIKSSFIGEMVMRKIKKIDNIAYIRFASVYRDFKDLDDLKKEIKELKK